MCSPRDGERDLEKLCARRDPQPTARTQLVQQAATDLGTGTVMTTPLSSGGLATNALSGSGPKFEFDLFLHRGRE